MKQNDVTEQEKTIRCCEELQKSGDHYASAGDNTQARQCYGEAASRFPDESGPYVGLGVVALQEELFDDAEMAFRVACRLDPDCSAAYAGLAMVAQQKADYDRAFAMYLKCLELDTDNLTALLGLFQASCKMGSFAKVIHYLELYLNMYPGDTSVKFSLGALYVKEGHFEKSRKILLDILTLDPENKDACNLLEEVERNLVQTKHPGGGLQ